MRRSAFPSALLSGVFALLGGVYIACAQTKPAIQDLYLAKNAVVKSAARGTIVVGFANSRDMGEKKNAASPTVEFARGGEVSSGLHVYNNSIVNIRDGSIDGLRAHNQCTIRIRGGNIFPYLTAEEHSTVVVIGGKVARLSPRDHSKVIVQGGDIGSLDAENDSVANIQGGSIRMDVSAYENSVVNVRGGNVRGSLIAMKNSVINLYGTDLKATLKETKMVHVPSERSGVYAAVFAPASPGDKETFSRYELSGKWEDGTSTNGKFLYVGNGTGARFILHSASHTGGGT